ncbi:hypothetical protein CLCR_07708 [Cladophialophora carrionii]|uniref:Ig-like domain-containing protein n=1 Tax=Cladophialophora carrionii TaxID=86049 RepID=A0A1C1CPQ6_9EURO|nr:hypothetical protein CLCR_07708 [Cladophialophora carrionii]
MKITAIASLLGTGAQLASGAPLAIRALGGTVVIRQSAQSSNAFIDTTVTIDLEGNRNPQALKVLSQRPKSVQAISTTSDAPFVTCDYTCQSRDGTNGDSVTCGSTTMKSGAESATLDVSWVDSVDSVICFVSATDPTA